MKFQNTKRQKKKYDECACVKTDIKFNEMDTYKYLYYTEEMHKNADCVALTVVK